MYLVGHNIFIDGIHSYGLWVTVLLFPDLCI